MNKSKRLDAMMDAYLNNNYQEAEKLLDEYTLENNIHGIHNIVKKMVGEISPAGDSSVDGDRFNNLKTICGVMEKLNEDIICISKNKNSHEHSVKKAGEYAYKFINFTKNYVY